MSHYPGQTDKSRRRQARGSGSLRKNDLQEIGAWIWAMLSAIVWTETADRVMAKALRSYGVEQAEIEEIQVMWNPCHRDEEQDVA